MTRELGSAPKHVALRVESHLSIEYIPTISSALPFNYIRELTDAIVVKKKKRVPYFPFVPVSSGSTQILPRTFTKEYSTGCQRKPLDHAGRLLYPTLPTLRANSAQLSNIPQDAFSRNPLRTTGGSL